MDTHRTATHVTTRRELLLARHTHRRYVAPVSVQAIAWSPSGAVRIVDQRALPEARIERDLETGEAVADAIRTLQVRGAPLIGIAAAMGLVAGTRELRARPEAGEGGGGRPRPPPGARRPAHRHRRCEGAGRGSARAAGDPAGAVPR